MSVTKQDVVNLLNTLAVKGSKRGCWNIGMAHVIAEMRNDAITGELEVFQFINGGEHWGVIKNNSEVVLRIKEMIRQDLPY